MNDINDIELEKRPHSPKWSNSTGRPHLQLILVMILTFLILNISIPILGCQVPQPFDDKVLPLDPTRSQSVAHLGQIIKLDTLLPPKRVSDVSTKFSIYNRLRTTENIVFTPDKLYFPQAPNVTYQYDLHAMSTSGFNISQKTVIMISGFLTSDKVGWMKRTKDVWLRLEEVNVILVTWSDANRYTYSRAVADTPLVARQITIFLYYLAQLNEMSIKDEAFISKIHFIGHSLGSHIAGFVGQDLGGRMGRITALDPAGPSFDQMSLEHRLDPSDAQLVDVIHTNSGKMKYWKAALSALKIAADGIIDRVPVLNLIPCPLDAEFAVEGDTAWYGIDKQIGHLDFYANNGGVQPGCNDRLHVCDHARSHAIFEDILNYELQLTKFPSTSQWRNKSRLIAFNSKDYDTFLSGKSIGNQCAGILTGMDGFSRRSSEARLSRVSVPIDLLTPVEELRRELQLTYGVSFTDSAYQSAHRYFFRTHSSRPLIGDHYLLQLHVNRKRSTWTDGCSLLAEMQMSNGIMTTTEVNSDSRIVDIDEHFYGFAMPFVNPLGAEARNALNEMLIISIVGNKMELERSVLSSVTKVLPIGLKISVSESKSSNILLSAAVELINLLRMGKKSEETDGSNCKLELTSIEVKPIVEYPRSIIGLYGSGLQVRPGLIWLLNSTDHAELIAGNRTRARELSTPSKQVLADLGLDAVVIG